MMFCPSLLILAHTLPFAHAFLIYSATAKSEVTSLSKAPLISLGQSEYALLCAPEFSPDARSYYLVIVYFPSSFNRQNLYLSNSLLFLLSDLPSAPST